MSVTGREADRADEVMLVEGTGRGFISQHTHALALLMHRQGVGVRLVTSVDCELARWAMPFARSMRLRRGALGWLDLARLVRRHRPGVVHFQWMARPWLGLPLVHAWQHQGVRIVYTPHNILPHCARWLSLPAYRAWYRAMDGIVARDRHIAWALEEVLEIPRQRMAVLPQNPNIVTLERPVATRETCHPPRVPGECRLLVFGHGGRGKGLTELCQSLLSRSWPSEVHLLLAGEQVTRGVAPALLTALHAHLRVTVLEGEAEAIRVCEDVVQTAALFR